MRKFIAEKLYMYLNEMKNWRAFDLNKKTNENMEFFIVFDFFSRDILHSQWLSFWIDFEISYFAYTQFGHRWIMMPHADVVVVVVAVKHQTEQVPKWTNTRINT